MKCKRVFNAFSQLAFVAFLVYLAAAAPVFAQENNKSELSGDVNGTRTISFETRRQFQCAEIFPDRAGDTIEHEISFTPHTVELCELEKVGSRLNECEKHNINVVTTNFHQINTIYTDGGIVQFWFENRARVDTADGPGALIFDWPNTENRYVCLPHE